MTDADATNAACPTAAPRRRPSRSRRPPATRDGRQRPDLARRAAAPAADDHLDRDPARPAGPRSSGSRSTSTSPSSPGASPSANKLLLLAAFLVFYVGFPMRGCAGRSCSRAPASTSGSRTRPRSCSCRGSSTASCRPSSATCTARSCSRSTPTCRCRGRSGTVFIERILDLFAIAIMGLAAGFWSFRTGCRPRSSSSSPSASATIVVLAGLLFTLRNFGRRILSRLPLPAPRPRSVRPVRGGRVRAIGAPPAAAADRPHVAHLGDRGAAAVLRRPGARVPGRRARASRAPFFVAFIGSLLTAVPLSPAGLGVVDAGMVGVLDAGLRHRRRRRRRRSSSSTA